jgi:antitoxin component of RelBE/YafQ-DinJ toxin-antitoxin module
MTDDVITFKIDAETKEKFKGFAQKYGGMTAVLLRLIHTYIEEEERKEWERQERQKRSPQEPKQE